MPCRCDDYDTYQDDRADAARSAWRTNAKQVADAATHAGDLLREHILGNGDNLAAAIRKDVDKLAAESDNAHSRLRGVDTADDARLMRLVEKLVNEYRRLLRLAVSPTTIPADELAAITRDQIAHRRADLDRLLKVFGATANRAMLTTVLAADPALPLEPQLGFDPDSY